MNRKTAWQSMLSLSAFMLAATSCSSDAPEANIRPDSDASDASVVFNINMPTGDEVNYTRADGDPATLEDDASESCIKSLKVYHFRASDVTDETSLTDADYTLVKSYDVIIGASNSTSTNNVLVPDATTADQYGLTLSLSTKANTTDRHLFAFVANDGCAAVDDAIATAEAANQDLSSITLANLKSGIADKQIKASATDANLLSGDVKSFLSDETGGLCMTYVLGNPPSL